MLLHSDVARLVLAYLAEENCTQTYQSFLNESIHLNSMRHAFAEEASDTAPITVFGKSLCGIIDEYYNMKDAEMQIWNIKNRRIKKNQKFLAIWKKLEEALAAVKSFQITSIVDGLQMKKSYCKNCESTMTQNGIVLTPSAPTDLIYHKNSGQKSIKTTSFHEVVPPPLEISNSSISSASAGEQSNQSEENRRRKTRRVPKKLTDVQRKDKETELRVDPSTLLLNNITGSGAMAVVGATIMTQMKKCTQSEKATCSLTPNTKFDIDANAAKHNQESIAQLSLQSLLSSDFNIDELEFGKELEELLGIENEQVPNESSRVPDAVASTHATVEGESQIFDMNISAAEVLPSEQIEDNSASSPVDGSLKMSVSVDVSSSKVDHTDVPVPDMFGSEVEVITSETTDTLAEAKGAQSGFPPSTTESALSGLQPSVDVPASASDVTITDRLPDQGYDKTTAKPKTERFFFGKPVVVNVSSISSERKSKCPIVTSVPISSSEPHGEQKQDETPPPNSTNPVLNSNLLSTSNSINLISPNQADNDNEADNDGDVIGTSRNVGCGVLETNNEKVTEKPQETTPSRDFVVDELDSNREENSTKRLSFSESDILSLRSPKEVTIVLQKLNEGEVQARSVEADPVINMTPKKSAIMPSSLNESPAKNTRSKTKSSSQKPAKKTPKVVIKSKNFEKKSKSRKKKEAKQKNAEKIARIDAEKSTATLSDSESFRKDPEPKSPSDSPKDVLAAVSLQSASSSPRKLTLRYGLRSTQMPSEETPSSALDPKKRACPDATLNELKDDLFDNLLADSRVSVAHVDSRVDHVTGDLTELNTFTSFTTPPSTSAVNTEAPSVAAESPRLSGIKSSASVVVSHDAVEMDTIMQQLVAQIRKSKNAAKTPSSVVTTSNADLNPTYSCSFTHSVLSPSKLSSTPAGRDIIEARTTTTQSIESKCQKHVTGDSLTELLNETSLTQLVEAVKNSEDCDWVCGPTPELNRKDSTDFQTISTTAGVFTCFDEARDSPSVTEQQPATASNILSVAAVSAQVPILASVAGTPIPTPTRSEPIPTPSRSEPVATCLTETEVATRNLRAWLSGSSFEPAPIIRRPTYTIRTPGTYRSMKSNKSKTFTKRQRKLLPKPVSSTPRTNPVPPATPSLEPTLRETIVTSAVIVHSDPLELEPVPSASRSTSQVVCSVPPASVERKVSDHSLDAHLSMPVMTSAPSASEISVVGESQITQSIGDVIDALDVAIAANEVVTSNNLASPTIETCATETDLDNVSYPAAGPSSRDVTLTTFTNQSPRLSVKPTSPPEEAISAPVKPAFEAVTVTPPPPTAPDPLPSTAVQHQDQSEDVAEKVNVGSRPDRRRSTSVRDSSEEHSLRIITSDEDRLSVFASPTLRKRKSSRRSSPRKKPRLEKFASSSMSDLVAFLKKIHGQPEDAPSDLGMSEKRKEKHLEQRLTDPVAIQNRVESGCMSPSRSVARRKSFEKHRAVSKPKSVSSTKLASWTRDDPRRKIKKKPQKTVEKAKRRVSLTSVPIPPSKLGGSPLHLRTPSPVLVCRDSPNTIALVAESLVELSRSRGSVPEVSPLASPSTPKISNTTTVVRSSEKKESSRRKKKKTKKKLSLDDINISEFLSTIKYD